MKYILSLLTFISSTYLLAQSFQQVHDLCYDTRGVAVHETKEGNYLAIGENYANAHCLSLVLLKPDGTLIKTKEYEFSDFYFDTFGRISVESDSNYLITGALSTPGTFEKNLILIKVSGSTLDTIWTKTYPHYRREAPSSIQKSKDGFTIAVKQDSLRINASGDTYVAKSYVVFVDVDQIGNLIKRTVLPDSLRFSYGADFHYLPENKMAITFRSGRSFLTPGDFVGVIDSTYRFVWKKQFKDVTTRSDPHLIVSADSTIIYASHIEEEWLTPTNDFYGYHGVVFAYDAKGELKWKTFLPTQRRYIIGDINLTSTGDLVLAGSEDFHNLTHDRILSKARISKVDKNGNRIWDFRYEYPGRESVFAWLSGVVETSSGGVIATGLTRKVITTPQNGSDLGFISVGEDGCLTPTCDDLETPIIFISNTNQINKDSVLFELRPNPASEYIEINTGKHFYNEDYNFRISDIYGKKVFEGSLSSQRIDANSWKQGIYIFQTFYKNQLLKSDKISVVH